MKTFVKCALLTCLLSLFVFDNLAMGQRIAPVPVPVPRNDRIPQNNARGVTVEPAPKPSPVLAQVQPPIQTQSQSVPPRVYPQPKRHAPQVQTVVVQQHLLHRGFGQGLRLGVGAKEYSGEGVLVTDVLANSPADIAGLVAGNVILEINRMPINDLTDYSYAVDRSRETMNMKVGHDGQEFMMTIELKY